MQKAQIPFEDSVEMWHLLRDARESTAAFLLVSFSNLHSRVPLKHIQALLYLAQNPDEGTGQLAKGIAASAAYASRVSNKLVGDSLLNRVRDKQDQRAVHLTLTKRGVEITQLLKASLEGPMVAALGKESLQSRKVIGQFLRKLSEEITKRSLRDDRDEQGPSTEIPATQ